MILKYTSFFFFVTVFLNTTASPTKDLILGRKYVVPAETPEETFKLLRLINSGTSVQQILYAIFTPIQAIISGILTLICSLILPITTIVEVLRAAIFENLISLIEVITPIISIALPQIEIVLQVLQPLLSATNTLLYNGTVIVQDYGCTTILSINNLVSSIADVIIGVF